MAQGMPVCPPSLKSVQHFLKIAVEHDNRDLAVSYWCRLYAMQSALKLDKSSPEAKQLLFYLIDWLENCKKNQKDNDIIMHEVAAQAYLENYALKLFLWADSQDRAEVFNKGVIKAFYTAGVIFDVLETFGELSEEVIHNRKYAKWKAAYIHNCLKNGETPVPGPADDDMRPAYYGDNIGFQVPKQEDYSPADKVINSYPEVPILPTNPSPSSSKIVTPVEPVSVPTSDSGVGAEVIAKAQKYCKFASSALTYEDIPTAVDNLQKALLLLQTGTDSG